MKYYQTAYYFIVVIYSCILNYIRRVSMFNNDTRFSWWWLNVWPPPIWWSNQLQWSWIFDLLKLWKKFAINQYPIKQMKEQCWWCEVHSWPFENGAQIVSKLSTCKVMPNILDALLANNIFGGFFFFFFVCQCTGIGRTFLIHFFYNPLSFL